MTTENYDLTGWTKVVQIAGFPIVKMRKVGSKFICGAGADEDMLMLVTSATHAKHLLKSAGWSLASGGEYTVGDFLAFRLGNLNAIVTDCVEFFAKFAAAAEACRYLEKAIPGSMQDKSRRLDLHSIIRDEVKSDELA